MLQNSFIILNFKVEQCSLLYKLKCFFHGPWNRPQIGLMFSFILTMFVYSWVLEFPTWDNLEKLDNYLFFTQKYYIRPGITSLIILDKKMLLQKYHIHGPWSSQISWKSIGNKCKNILLKNFLV